MDSAPALKIQLFGRAQVLIHGNPLPKMRSRKELWLLALLACERSGDVSRAWLAQTLWPSPDYSIDLANNYLRRSLMEVRKALGDQAGRIQAAGARALCLDLQGAEVDVLAFDAALARKDAAGLAEAVELYAGPFLVECAEAWVLPMRERYAQSYGRALQDLAARGMAVGDYDAAERFLRLALASDPLSEPASRSLMDLFRRRGDFAEALRVYRELEERMRRDNSAPSDDTLKLFQRIAAGDRTRRAPVAASSAPEPVDKPTTLAAGYVPVPVTPLVGREDALVEIKTALGTSRLVTLVGTGGVGKTRLAIEMAEHVRGEFPDGVWFIDLAPVTEESRVAQTVASTLGVRDDAAASLDVALTDFLRNRSALLILDNCEHLTEACALLTGRVLAHARGVKVVATSRNLLGLMGERVYRVPPLEIPDTLPKDAGDRIALVSSTAATRLFAERASAADGRFRISADNSELLVSLCRQLDGVPLAIELAAARVRVLGLQDIAGRLDNRFRLLTSQSSTLEPRQQTLYALIDWSYNLLSHPERLLLTRLSVFRGGCTVDAAEAVCADSDLPEFDVLDLLTALVDKSLAYVDHDADGRTRFRLLVNVRAFAAEKLEGEESVRRRHAAWCARFVQQAEPELRGRGQTLWMKRIGTEYNNLRGAAEWSCRLPAEDDLPLRLVSGLWRYWIANGRFAEAGERLAAALSGRPMDTREAALCAVHRALFLEFEGKDNPGAGLPDALAAARALGDAWTVVFATYVTGWTARHDDWAEGMAIVRQALEDSRKLDDPWLTADILNTLGFLTLYHGETEEAEALLSEGLRAATATGDSLLTSETMYHYALLKSVRGELAEARHLFQESMRHQALSGDVNLVGAIMHYLGWISVAEGDLSAARETFVESLRMREFIGMRRAMIASLEGAAYTEVYCGKETRAARLLGAVSALSAGNRLPALQFWRFDLTELSSELRSRMARPDFELSWSAGERSTLEEAVAFAIATPE